MSEETFVNENVVPSDTDSPQVEPAVEGTVLDAGKKRRFSTCENPKQVCYDIFSQLQPGEKRKVALERCIEAGVTFNTADLNYYYWNKARKENEAGQPPLQESQQAA